MLSVTAHERAAAPASALNEYAVPAWNDYQATEAIPLFDDLIIARISPETSPWYKRLLALTSSPGDRIVGLTPAPGPMRSAR